MTDRRVQALKDEAHRATCVRTNLHQDDKVVGNWSERSCPELHSQRSKAGRLIDGTRMLFDSQEAMRSTERFTEKGFQDEDAKQSSCSLFSCDNSPMPLANHSFTPSRKLQSSTINFNTLNPSPTASALGLTTCPTSSLTCLHHQNSAQESAPVQRGRCPASSREAEGVVSTSTPTYQPSNLKINSMINRSKRDNSRPTSRMLQSSLKPRAS